MSKFDPTELQKLIDDIQETSRQNNDKIVTVSDDGIYRLADAPKTDVIASQPEAVPAEEKPAGKRKKKKAKRVHWYSKFLIFVDLCAVICFYFAYGPVSVARDWLVTTAITTGRHKYLAYVLYDEDMVNSVLEKNATIETDAQTNKSLIHIVDNPDTGTYENIYEEQVVKHDEGQLYKVIEVDEDNYKGYLTVIYEPARLKLAMAKSKYGDTITTFAKNNKAIVAVNGGGYKRNSEDIIYSKGTVIQNGKIIKDSGAASNLIAMSTDGILMLIKSTAKDAVAQGVDWAVMFKPFLIVNGVQTEFVGNGGYGIQPRTAIGQRADGIVILVTIDGRGAGGSSGISIPNLTALMARYGCVNAANLDGGGSTMLAINGKLYNNPRGTSYTGERNVYNAIIYK
ncbi:MAG: phosphodiester glycosidase family protein [Erysipelotrichaceae bacterium]|nr:phosphodiester glycosidase family protein [Erysipelotrichaceae bacterium]